MSACAFYVVYFGPKENGRRVVLGGPFGSVQEAAAFRRVSGDVVTDCQMNPVQSEEWLWEWERGNPYSYAAKMAGNVRRS